MPDVGFEPTRANTGDLESPPLDQTLVTRLIMIHILMTYKYDNDAYFKNISDRLPLGSSI